MKLIPLLAIGVLLISCQDKPGHEFDSFSNGSVQKNFLTVDDTLDLINHLSNLLESGDNSELWEQFNYSEVDGFVFGEDFLGYFASNKISSFQDIQGISSSPLLNGKALYRPFYDKEFDSTTRSFVFFNDISENIYQYDIDPYGNIEMSTLSTHILPENDFVFIVDEGYVTSRALPWRRCYCSRGRYDPETGIYSSQGACSQGKNDEHCGQCARADFGGNCPGGACPGC